MNKAEYQQYEKNVQEFFETEGIANLSAGHFKCPECDVEFNDKDKCPNCDGDREAFDEPYFSWSSCECCGGIAGNRQFATGYNPTTKEVHEYDVCEDCIYYSEYGRLNDMTMMDMEDE